MPETSGVELLQAVQKQVKQIQTSSLDLSFNELLDMYTSQELIIDPEYQRAFRWSEGKESRFIESLVLGMPIPPIFVIELEDSKYELIDGLQRLSSYFHFRGAIELEIFDKHIKKGEGLQLRECDIVRELNGLDHDHLPTAMQIRLKRHFIRVEVVKKDSDQRLRYHMFKRLNTGGETLSQQEIRNCTVRLLEGGATFMRFLTELSNTEGFRVCTLNLSEENYQQKFDQELVLRFFAFKNNRDEYVHDVSDFMTDYMESIADPEIASPFDYDGEKQVFLRTFTTLAKLLEDRAFGWVNKAGTIVRGFAVYHFEAFTLGIQPFLGRVNLDDAAQTREPSRSHGGHKARSRFPRDYDWRRSQFARRARGADRFCPHGTRTRIVTIDIVWAQLEQELLWRQQEIRLLSNTRNALKTEDDRDRFRRAQLVMLYAHAEGFCKIALLIYAKSINIQQMQRSLACDELVASSLAQLFHALEFGDKKGKVFRSPAPQDEKFLLLFRRRDFVREIDAFMRSPLLIPDEAVDLQDNLNSTVLRKSLFRLGFPVDLMASYEEALNELVNRRNDIAHGLYDTVVRAADYERLERAVLNAMDHIVLRIIDALEQQTYLRPSAATDPVDHLSVGEMC